MFPYVNILNRQISLYGTCVVVGILMAAWFAVYKCKKNNLIWEDAIVIGITGVGCGLAGAKILYILVTFSFEELIRIFEAGRWDLILNGGFVFYGGFIFGVLGALLGAKIANTKVSVYSNILTECIPLAHAFGRLGCFCAGCCYGRPADSVFSVIYKQPIGTAPIGVPLIPIQLYEVILNIFIFAVLLFIDKYKKGRISIIPYYLCFYGTGRFIMEYFRYDYARGMYLGLSTSQIISIVLIICAAVLLIADRKKCKTDIE